MSAADNRAAFPETAKLVDELRTVFGTDVKLMWASEGVREIGVRGPEGVPVTRVARLDKTEKPGRTGA